MDARRIFTSLPLFGSKGKYLKRMRRWHLVLGIAAFALVLVGALPQYVPKIESRNWPVAEGMITRSRIQTAYGVRNMKGSVPDVEYRYSVGGQLRRGHLINFFANEVLHTDADASRIIQAYPVGQKVRVYYNPTSSGEAVLETGLNGEQQVVLVAGIAYIVGCVAVLLFIWRDSLRAKREGSAVLF